MADNEERFMAIRIKLEAVREIIKDTGLTIHDDLPEDIRYDLLNLACSLNDFIFWVTEPEKSEWKCHEIETGISAHGNTALAAVQNYFLGDTNYESEEQNGD